MRYVSRTWVPVTIPYEVNDKVTRSTGVGFVSPKKRRPVGITGQ
jgi:hypothetical protein